MLNFSAKIGAYAEAFGIPPAWVAEIVDSSGLLNQVMLLLELLRTTTNQVVVFKDALLDQNPENPNVVVNMKALPMLPKDALSSLPNILARAIAVADILLANPLCTESIRKDLGLVKPTETEITETTGKQRRPVVVNAPVLKASVAGHTITIKILKGRAFNGLMANVYANRSDKNEFEYLTSTNKGSVTDRAVFAEGVQLVTYSYKVQMMNGDVPVGDASDVLIVVAQRPLA